ncbi:MAG: tRNA methyltransferase [Desulfobacteraceae bacterium 4572_35.2]|nr:MAG: tRNA methyltransferase [Desulfobacteraceae bacterium 4572_35.2]
METIEFDNCGQLCPSTLLTALREVNTYRDQLQQGSHQLVIKTDARDATRTIPDAVENMGYQVEISKQHSIYVIRIYK